MKGHGKVYFVDAAHLLHNAVPGHGWIKRGKTVELKTNSGRNRLNVLGAYSPDDHTLISIEGTESCDADLVGQLLRKVPYYATFADFRAAIQRLLTNLATYTEELAPLMTENFHLFGETG